MNNKGLSVVVLLVVIILAVAGGIFFLVRQTPQSQTGSGNGNQAPASSDIGTTGNNIELKGFAFSPNTLTISVGETVTWTNKDSASHTITSDSGNELGSSSMGNGQTYLHTFSTAGTYAYHCSIHSTMKGRIVVQ